MEVLRYSDLDVKGLEKQVLHIESALRVPNFALAQVKKLAPSRYYRAKLNDADRLLFAIVLHGGKKYILLLEVIRNHEYSKSRFLNGADIDESKIEDIPSIDKIPEASIQPMVYLNPKLRHFHLLDKVISFDDLQNEVFSLKPPLILIGSAGSGKTALTLEKLKLLSGDILYVTLSPFLAESARNIYYSSGYENDEQAIDFLSYQEFIESIRAPKGEAMTYRRFADWIKRHHHSARVNDPHKIYEEIHGVITGSSVDNAYLSRDEYGNLGIRQSIFLGEEKNAVYDIFKSYIEFICEAGLYNLNMAAHSLIGTVSQKYDFVVADEVQDLTNIQLYLAMKTLRDPDNFILCGDSNQSVHPNFFSWANVKSLFYEQRIKGRAEIIRILCSNYRNAPEVTELANRILLIKHAKFGSIDRESNYLIKPVSEHKGETGFFTDDQKNRNEFNNRTRRSAKTAILVMRDEDKAEAKKIFQTPLIFSIQEAKGLEYESIVILNFVSDNAKVFTEIIEDVTAEDISRSEIRYARAKDKSDKSLDAYKFFINALYVAITRSVKNLYILERQTTHRIFNLLGLELKREQVLIKSQESTQQEWKDEARKLELQGKHEQAEEIRRTILAQKEVPWKVLTPTNMDDLKKEALDPNNFNRQAKLLLFEYAVTHSVPHLFDELVKLKFGPANNPHSQTQSIELKYYNDYRSRNPVDLKRKIDMYGIDYRNQLNQTPLMIAAQLGNHELAEWLIANGAGTQLADNWGRNPLQIALRQAYMNPDYANKHMGRFYKLLAPSSIKVMINGIMIKVDNKRMEFFLLNSMIAMLQDILRRKVWHQSRSFKTDDFVHALVHFPDYVIPEYRKKRSYITSVLARNEYFKDDIYKRRLFLRVSHGYYILTPSLEVEIQNKWINIYDLIHMKDMLSEHESQPATQRFAKQVMHARDRIATGQFNVPDDYYANLRQEMEELRKTNANLQQEPPSARKPDTIDYF